ncbi:unnamed protein product [Hymenolepis diminuta]|uniref:Uncharacterized protein n=1 Tax=Hymenolepis diminuta TaxID=6216 RepID=A0A564YC88_HYMDI|nr:unnamed protein product [Hymenolepis diminuta]
MQRPSQPIRSHYPCSLALFVFKGQTRGQRLIRSSVHKIKFLTSHRLRINEPSLLNTFPVLATLGAA